MQILTIKQIQNTSVDVTTRYKITLYDGDMQHTFGILATQKNHTIENEELKIGSVIKLTEYAANVLSKEPQKLVNQSIITSIAFHQFIYPFII